MKTRRQRAGIYVVATESFASIRNFGVRSIYSIIITDAQGMSRTNMVKMSVLILVESRYTDGVALQDSIRLLPVNPENT